MPRCRASSTGSPFVPSNMSIALISSVQMYSTLRISSRMLSRSPSMSTPEYSVPPLPEQSVPVIPEQYVPPVPEQSVPPRQAGFVTS